VVSIKTNSAFILHFFHFQMLLPLVKPGATTFCQTVFHLLSHRILAGM
jgi:hypothetical protein